MLIQKRQAAEDDSKMSETVSAKGNDLYSNDDDDMIMMNGSMGMGMGVTPGENALTFSTMDMNKGTLEITNESNESINLSGYTLTDRDGQRSMPLPANRTLRPSLCHFFAYFCVFFVF